MAGSTEQIHKDITSLQAVQTGSDGHACLLCPRKCGVDRSEEAGYCGVTNTLRVARAALHMWEEPCISGKEGSGTVFFSGCNLGCIYCQNRDIALGKAGYDISLERLAEIFLEQQQRGANNINLVTAAHYVPQVVEALDKARANGLTLPVVYNSSGYESVETLRQLEGYVDVWLPDYKYADKEIAKAYSKAEDYPEVAWKAIEEMVRQTVHHLPGPAFTFNKHGIMTRGVIVRLLLLPGHVKDAKERVRRLYEAYGDNMILSLMSQYTPMPQLKDDPLLGRRVTRREYEKLVDYALDLGVTNAFVQEMETAKESFIPAFDGEGVLRRG